MACGSIGGGKREAAVLRNAAMVDVALSNWVSRGFHYMVLALEEEEGGAMGGGRAKEQDSNDNNEDDSDGLVMARA